MELHLKTSAQQEKQSTKQKDNLQNGKKYLQTMYQIRGYHPKYITKKSNLKNGQRTGIDTSPQRAYGCQ